MLALENVIRREHAARRQVRPSSLELEEHVLSSVQAVVEEEADLPNFVEHHRQQLSRVLRARWSESHILFIYALRIAMHYHYAALTRALAQVETGSLPNAGRSFSRASRRIESESKAAA